MSRSPVLRSVQLFGYYTLLMGGTLLFSPTGLLPFLFGAEAAVNDWARLLGFVLLCSGYYYIQAARTNDYRFCAWTVHTRLASILVVAGLVFVDEAPLRFLPMGLIDALAGLLTGWYIANEKQARSDRY
nr:hypothetical protein [uncultured Arsenicibacter sp.]